MRSHLGVADIVAREQTGVVERQHSCKGLGDVDTAFRCDQGSMRAARLTWAP